VLHHPDDDPLGGFGLPKPRGLSDFVEGLARWHNRVIGYAVPWSLTPIRGSGSWGR
jgi:hypothetical protein